MSKHDSRLVYSSENPGAEKEKGKSCNRRYQKGSGPCRVRLEKKGRHGKQVTIISNLPYELPEARKLLKQLQTKFACGASLKESELILSGNYCDQIRSLIRDNII